MHILLPLFTGYFHYWNECGDAGGVCKKVQSVESWSLLDPKFDDIDSLRRDPMDVCEGWKIATAVSVQDMIKRIYQFSNETGYSERQADISNYLFHMVSLKTTISNIKKRLYTFPTRKFQPLFLFSFSFLSFALLIKRHGSSMWVATHKTIYNIREGICCIVSDILEKLATTVADGLVKPRKRSVMDLINFLQMQCLFDWFK